MCKRSWILKVIASDFLLCYSFSLRSFVVFLYLVHELLCLVFFLSSVLHVTLNKMKLRMRKASQQPNLARRPSPARTKRKHSEMEECSGDSKGLLSSIKKFIHGSSIKVSLKQPLSVFYYEFSECGRSRPLQLFSWF